MKLEDIDPNTGLAFRPVGRNLKIGNWRIEDAVDCDGIQFRQVYHYGTLMGEWYKTIPNYTTGQADWEHEVFQFAPLSVGHGSCSDQQGMNRIMRNTTWTYKRSGGVARYEAPNGRRFPH